MDLQEKIEALEKEFNEKIEILKSEAQQEQEFFPEIGEYYFHINDTGDIYRTEYAPPYNDNDYEYRKDIGNIFRTRDEACFAVEKLKVEAELRKFSTKYKPYTELYRLAFHSNSEKIIDVVANQSFQDITFHFADRDVAMEAVKSIGEHRIKKYIFGVED